MRKRRQWTVIRPEDDRPLEVSHLIVGGLYHIGIEKFGTWNFIQQQEFAERIARLLTEDEERIARDAHRQRLWNHYEARPHPDGPLWDAWIMWREAIVACRPLQELDQLERMYEDMRDKETRNT